MELEKTKEELKQAKSATGQPVTMIDGPPAPYVVPWYHHYCT